MADKASIIVLHLPSGKIMASLEYQKDLKEIYDIHVLPNCIRPNIFNTYKEDHHRGLYLQGAVAWAVKPEKNTEKIKKGHIFPQKYFPHPAPNMHILRALLATRYKNLNIFTFGRDFVCCWSN